MKLFKSKKKIAEIAGKRVAKAIEKELPKNTAWAIVFFEPNKEESIIRYLANIPKKNVHRVWRNLSKEWRNKYEI